MSTFKGISFPFKISSTTGGVETAKVDDAGDTTLLRQSIIQSITTGLTERVQEKYFGTELWNMVFDPNDTVSTSLMIQSITKAITLHEPRVAVMDIKMNQDVDNGEVVIGIKFQVKRTGAIEAFAFSL